MTSILNHSIWESPPLLVKMANKKAKKRELMREISDKIYGSI